MSTSVHPVADGVYRLYALAKFQNFCFGSRNQVGLFACLFKAGKQKYKYLTCHYVTYKHDEQFTSVKNKMFHVLQNDPINDLITDCYC